MDQYVENSACYERHECFVICFSKLYPLRSRLDLIIFGILFVSYLEFVVHTVEKKAGSA